MRQAGTVPPNRSQPSGLKIRSVVAGYCRSFSGGRIGRLTSSPPQFGQIPCNTWVAQALQNVHSKEQIRASTACGGSSLLQHSQFGRSWSIGFLSHTYRTDGLPDAWAKSILTLIDDHNHTDSLTARLIHA